MPDEDYVAINGQVQSLYRSTATVEDRTSRVSNTENGLMQSILTLVALSAEENERYEVQDDGGGVPFDLIPL